MGTYAWTLTQFLVVKEGRQQTAIQKSTVVAGMVWLLCMSLQDECCQLSDT